VPKKRTEKKTTTAEMRSHDDEKKAKNTKKYKGIKREEKLNLRRKIKKAGTQRR
jgi:hypothetical protein